MKSKSRESYQDKKQKEAIKMVKELLRKLERRELIVEEHGWWQAGSPERYTFRVTATTNQN